MNTNALNEITANKAGASALAVQTFNKGILNPEQAGRFIREITNEQVVLREASIITMKSHTKNLDRVTVDGRVLHAGYDVDGNTRVLSDSEKAKIKTWQNQLVVAKLKTQAEIEDDELEDNLEGKAFIDTLLDLVAGQIGEDKEVWALGANKGVISYAEDDLLSTTTGWLHRPATKVYNKPLESEGIEAIFDAMLAAIPKKFIKNRNNMRLYVPYEYEKAWRDELKSRGTPLGDSVTTGYAQLAYENIPVVHVPSLDDTVLQTLTGSPALMLTDPANLVMGIWRQIGIEPERHAAEEKTEYVITMRGDTNLINEFASVSCFPEMEAPVGG